MSQTASDLSTALTSARREALTARERLRRLAAATGVLGRLTPAEAADAACRTLADLLALDSAWLVADAGPHLHVRGVWTRSGTTGRLGDHRLRAIAEAAEGDAWQGRDGRYAVVAARIPHSQAPLMLLGAVRSARELDEEDLACARLVAAAHANALDSPAAVVAIPSGRTDDHMLLLQSLAAALARARSESDVAWAVVDELRTLIDCHACRFYLLSPTGERLLAIAHSGSGSVEAPGGELLECAVDEGITGRAARDGLARRIPNARLDPDAVAIPGTGQDDESMLVAPMRIDGDTIGVIVLTKLGADRFDERDLRLLEVIASTAAVGCENARLYAQAREQADVAQALLDLGMALSIQASVDDVARMVASAVDRLLECAALSVWLRDGDCLRLVAQAGYTPEEAERLDGARLHPTAAPFGDALDRRLITVRSVPEATGLVACLDHAPPGSTFDIAAIGERAGNRGAIVVQRGPRRGMLSFREEELLLGIADQALLAITNRALYAELEASFLATMQALANALETKDAYTGDHAQALIGLSTRVAERLGVSGSELRDVSFAAALHDVGKIGIPAAILNKPSALTPDEWRVMRLHPELGARILEPVSALAGARELVLACHEHWDGSGYPLGLCDTRIPLGARIILACDAFHAMTSDRVYRAALPLEEAIDELRRCAGSHFDPEVATALIDTIAEELDQARAE